MGNKIIANIAKGNDDEEMVLELYLMIGCWTEQMKHQVVKDSIDRLGDVFSEIKFFELKKDK